MQYLRFAVAVLAIILTAGLAKAADRVALVIGNSDYAHATKLPNPKNDASDIGDTLEKLGFEVTRAIDVGYDEMRRELINFSRSATGADMAVVFYAGHGMEVDKQNYLIPTDAALETDRDISFEAVPLDLITEAVSGAKQLKLVMLDACRNNPFAATMKRTVATRSIGRGLARMEPVAGTLVAFAAKEGTVADDGRGRNSPFTKALLANLEEPGLEINFLFRKVRDSVMEDTEDRQQPFTYGSLPGRAIYFKDPVPGGEAGLGGSASDLRDQLEQLRKQLEARDGGGNSADKAAERRAEISLWESVRKSDDPGVLFEYLKAYPNGLFTEQAVEKLGRLQSEKKEEHASLPPPKQRDTRAPAEIKSEGNEAYDRGDYFNAFRLYKQIEDSGDFGNLNRLGYMYQHGQGTEKDLKLAVEYYKRSADGGFAPGIHNMGVMYERGYGVTRNYAEAVRYFRLAVDKGNANAQASLGYAYEMGNGVRKDINEAARLYKLAADQGNTIAQYNLGNFYVNGKGVRKDYGEGFRLLKLAADTGYGPAQHNLALLYMDGNGVGKNARKAAELIAAAIRGGNQFSIDQMKTNSTAYTKQTLMELQRILTSAGYYSGGIDGSIGGATVTAIEQYAGR